MEHRYHPDHVAHLAAILLSGHNGAEPHHVRHAVATAIAILDETHPVEEPEPAEGEGTGDHDDDGEKEPPAA